MEYMKMVDLLVLTKQLMQTYKEKENQRFIVGIIGIPGAGKSTLANLLMESINNIFCQEIAVVVPMDGFHYHNEILIKKGLLAAKGSPATFDSEKFLLLIRKIASETVENIDCPAYDRKLHNPVEDSILIESKHKIIIVEGNYLLLDTWPWNELGTLFAESWFLDIPLSTAKERLLKRHVATGRSSEEALDKIHGIDMPNAEVILQTRYKADKVISVVALEMQ